MKNLSHVYNWRDFIRVAGHGKKDKAAASHSRAWANSPRHRHQHTPAAALASVREILVSGWYGDGLYRTPTHPEVYPAGFPQNDRQRPPCHSSEKNADRDAAGGSNKVGDRNEMGLGLGLGHDDGRTEGKELERPNGKRAPRVSRQGQAAMSRVEKEDDEEMDYENGRSDRWNTEKLTMRSMGTDEKRDEVEVVGNREGSMGGCLHGSRKGIGKIWRSGKQRDPGTAQRAKGRREGDGWECDDREGSGKTKRKPLPISRSWSSASAEGLCLNVRLRQSVVRGRTSPVMHFRCGDSSKKRFSRPYESGDQMKGLSSGATQIVRRIARKTSRGAEYE
ncbi:hypothetical protein C8J57DRAFT_1470721 [Mycena rebaudengoi]|nr:hypothetical protein C8J57DRAFT_1470721 [Mycena rebaudengoi]